MFFVQQDVFNEQMDELCAILRELLERQRQRKRLTGTMLPTGPWWWILRRLVQRFDTPNIRVGLLVEEALIPRKSELSGISVICLHLIAGYEGCPDRGDSFATVVQVLVKLLAIKYALSSLAGGIDRLRSAIMRTVRGH